MNMQCHEKGWLSQHIKYTLFSTRINFQFYLKMSPCSKDFLALNAIILSFLQLITIKWYKYTIIFFVTVSFILYDPHLHCFSAPSNINFGFHGFTKNNCFVWPNVFLCVSTSTLGPVCRLCIYFQHFEIYLHLVRHHTKACYVCVIFIT